ncbi:MAG: hypothetical protein ACXVRX_11515 [Solirubrobacteraceae bacterium]
MSVSPIGGVTGTSALQQPTAAQIAAATAPATSGAAQTSPTVDAAQAWEDAMRAAMGDESSTTTSDPLSALSTPAAATGGAATTTPATSAAGPATTTPATSAAGQATTTPATSAAGQATTTPALTPQALAALVSGSSSASPDPLVTSLSAPAGASTPTSDASAGSFV